jgi:hypothetical protein
MADPNDDDNDAESVIEDLILNDTTMMEEVEINENPNMDIANQNQTSGTTSEQLPPDIMETPEPPPTFIPVDQPPQDPFVSQPVVRVALLDFNFKPTSGEIYQVNSEGHLLKLSLRKGMLFQVNNMGCLQEVPLPLPVKPE